jgi:hypothetical protein
LNELDATLSRLGDALEGSAAAQFAAEKSVATRRRRRRWLSAATVVLIAVPGAALAADALISTDDVERGLPAGTLALYGTEPSCAIVKQDVEYLCTLAKAPAPEVLDWKGTVEHTVDDTKHVNGGCRALTSDGREWRCYIGEAAVEQRIISAGFLGEYAPVPGVG